MKKKTKKNLTMKKEIKSHFDLKLTKKIGGDKLTEYKVSVRQCIN